MMERRIANGKRPKREIREKRFNSYHVTRTDKAVTCVSISGRRVSCENVSHVQSKMFPFNDGCRVTLALEQIDVVLIKYITRGLISDEIRLVGMDIFDDTVDNNDRGSKDVTYLKYEGFVPLIFQEELKLRVRQITMDKRYSGAELVVYDARFPRQAIKPNVLYIVKDNREMKVTRTGTKRWLETGRNWINRVLTRRGLNASEEILTIRLSALSSDGERSSTVIVNVPKRLVKIGRYQIICINKNYLRRKQLEVDLDCGRHGVIEINLDYHSEITVVKELFELDKGADVDSWKCNNFKQLKDTLIIFNPH